GLPGDVAKSAGAVIEEERIPSLHARNVQVGIPIVVYVREGSRNRNAVVQPDAGFLRDILEPTPADVSPELVLTDGRDEIDIDQPVPIDIGHGDAIPVVVVIGHPGSARRVHDLIPECDTALTEPIGEGKPVEYVISRGCFSLRQP